MLLRMLPEQVSEQWTIIKEAIQASAGVYTIPEAKMTNILSMLLSGNMQCWVLVDGNNRADVYAVITTFTYDDPLGEKTLFVFSLYAYKNIPIRLWKSLFGTLKRWAKSLGCSSVSAYVRNEAEKKLLERMGGDIKTVLVRVPLETNGRL